MRSDWDYCLELPIAIQMIHTNFSHFDRQEVIIVFPMMKLGACKRSVHCVLPMHYINCLIIIDIYKLHILSLFLFSIFSFVGRESGSNPKNDDILTNHESPHYHVIFIDCRMSKSHKTWENLNAYLVILSLIKLLTE